VALAQSININAIIARRYRALAPRGAAWAHQRQRHKRIGGSENAAGIINGEINQQVNEK